MQVEVARARARGAYRQATRLGQPLETVMSYRPATIDFLDSSTQSAESVQLTQAAFARRRRGSLFLSYQEWDALHASRPFWPEPDIMEHLRVLRSPWLRAVPESTPNIVLLDARCMQPEWENGTKRHAIAVARAIASALPEGYQLALFTEPLLPELPDDIRSLATVEWRPGLLFHVATFVQMATMCDPLQTCDLDFLRAPWIRHMAVFLDNIQGIYPHHFIGGQREFWIHQLGIEKLRNCDVVLALSETSRSEAVALWQSLPDSLPQPEFIVSSCISALTGIGSEVGAMPRRAHMLALGNSLPHKNVALVASAVGLLHEQSDVRVEVCFPSGFSAEMVSALGDLAPGSPSLSFTPRPTDEELAGLLRSAAAVIIPTLHEGFSLPVVESLERGTPVLLSRIPAHQELLPEGPWFFDPTDPSSLAEAILAFHQGGGSWSDAQRLGLAERYSPMTLPQRVGEGLRRCLEQAPTSPLPQPVPRSTERSSPPPASPIRELHQLRANDATFMRSVLVRPRETPQPAGAPTPLVVTLSKVEHDEIVQKFHRSRSWRVGRIFAIPVQALRTMVGARRQ
jgi:glycosyltransferase involved in cell wall biosynthesis